MLKKALIDSGPLVALFDKDDNYHQKALNFIQQNKFILYSNLAVVTETFYLLQFNINVQKLFIRWIKDGAVFILDFNQIEFTNIFSLLEKYQDIKPDFADLTLVVQSEKTNIYNVATIDSDFYVYKLKNKKYFKNVFLTD